MLTIIKTSIHLIILSFLLTNPLRANEITQQNWINHPEIKHVRALYKAIEKREKAHQLQKKVKTLACESSATTLTAIIYNEKTSTQKFSLQAQTEDSRETNLYYYDQEGGLRFMLSIYREADHIHTETRGYYDSKGQPLYTDFRTIKGAKLAHKPLNEIHNPNINFNHLQCPSSTHQH